MKTNTKIEDGIVFHKELFMNIASKDIRYMTDGYTYYGWGGINRCPGMMDEIWVNHEEKVFQVVHWTEK